MVQKSPMKRASILFMAGTLAASMLVLASCDRDDQKPAAQPAPQAPSPSVAPTVSEVMTTAVPQAFRGVWASDLDECAAEDSTGKMSLTIGAESITYSETSDAVIAVNEITPESVRLTVDHDNDGDVRRLERTLTLSHDRQTLSFNYGDDPHVVIRCPQG